VGFDLVARAGEVRYAKVGERHLAYREVTGAGSGDHDAVLVLSGTMPMDALFEDRVAVRLVDGLAALGRLVLFDRCGIGLSDAPADGDPATYNRWCDDLEAVVAAAGVERPVLVGNLLGAPVPFLYADRHSDGLTAIVLVEPVPPGPADNPLVSARIATDAASFLCPSRADEPGFREWFDRAGRLGASPGMAQRVYPHPDRAELAVIETACARVRVPALVLRRPANDASPRRERDPMLELAPTAVRVDIPGNDLLSFGAELDALLDEVYRFVTGEHRALEPERILAAILYTDLVASTERAAAVGDARWRHVLDRHDDMARACVGRRGGTVIKTMGDGVLALFPAASGAIRAARELRAGLTAEGLEMRAGIHVGDVDRRGDDISGVAAAIAARILALAGPSEILASGIATGAASGEEGQFEPRGEHELKGVPGTWSIFAVG
jgi:class 3 adenylate cyclase